MDKKWTKRWRKWVAPTKVPGVWRIKEGGYLVRARVTDPATGKMREIKKVLTEANEATAFKWLHDERARVKAGLVADERQRMPFGDFAVSLFEQKVKLGQIRSAKGRERWRYTLEHLIGGTKGEQAGKTVPGFGEFFVDSIRMAHVEAWKLSIADLIRAGDYAPTTCNGWLSILRVIMKAAHRTYSLPHLATEGVGNFDISEHETYTEEEPNSLLPGEVPEFLRAMQESYPQHYAMVYLGLATGLRPSSLRPLRRNGPTPDILWDDCKLLVRRSHSLGEEVMNTTKQRVRYRIHLPPEVMDVLRWHVRTQLTAPEQQESDLLFPSVTGSFRAASVLNKPLADVARAIGLNKRFTQCGLRRTFNDLARAAEVQSIVTRSISGHLTQQMQQHYSTVNADEQRESIGKVIGLMQARDRGARTASGGAQGGAQGSASGAQTKKAG
jgi:hypothetical protein